MKKLVLLAALAAVPVQAEPKVPLPWWVCLTYRQEVPGPVKLKVTTIALLGTADEEFAHNYAKDVRDNGLTDPVDDPSNPRRRIYLPRPPHPAIVSVQVEAFDYDGGSQVCQTPMGFAPMTVTAKDGAR